MLKFYTLRLMPSFFAFSPSKATLAMEPQPALRPLPNGHPGAVEDRFGALRYGPLRHSEWAAAESPLLPLAPQALGPRS
jgi:hypothetical protein